jgi:hypothetical protein
MKTPDQMDMGDPSTPEQENDPGVDEATKIWKKMKEVLPAEADFYIEPNILSKEENRRSEVFKFFEYEKLIEFIKENPRLVKKILTFQRLLTGKF